MREGSGETTILAPPAAVFAYLADPHRAPEWFAGVAVEDVPPGLPRQGMTWRFVQTQRSGQASPTILDTYEAPRHFRWRTTRRWPGDNLSWDVACAPVEGQPGSTLARFSIHLAPGPLGWLSLLVASPFQQGVVAARAQRAIERARDILEGRQSRLRATAPMRPHSRRKPHERSRR